jgi:hypothetical protein
VPILAGPDLRGANWVEAGADRRFRRALLVRARRCWEPLGRRRGRVYVDDWGSSPAPCASIGSPSWARARAHAPADRRARRAGFCQRAYVDEMTYRSDRRLGPHLNGLVARR